jgi:hypothetical protein
MAVDAAREGTTERRGVDAIPRFEEAAKRDANELHLPAGRAPQTMVAALVAWAVTVAPTVAAKGASPLARALAVVAILAGVGGPALAFTGRALPLRLARHVGITLFVALSLASWLAYDVFLHPSRLEPVRGALGGAAWAVFALAWRDSWAPASTPVADPSAAPLEARAHLPPLAALLAALGVVSSLACLTLTWRVREPERALVAQVAALACAVGLVSACATVAVGRGRPRATARRLSGPPLRALVALFLVMLGGVAYATYKR